jgi:uncharacterized membrane-anchored protein
MKPMSLLVALVAALGLAPAVAATPTSPDNAAAAQRIRAISERLHPVGGDVRIPGANAVLHLGRDYYFLPANEAQLVLTEAWGNPADVSVGVLGMVFPTGKTFADDTWGAVITYEATGYVSDSDAQSTDYGELMRQMQSGEEANNAELTRQGFPTSQLIGWAQSPVYDVRTHSVVWARNIRFQNSTENTLNYDIRLLGRRGVLSLNMVTVMPKLAETRQAAQQFAAAAEFVPGERYADFQPGRDRVAEYGISGLIAGGVGLAVAKKAGLLAVILAFGKKIIIFVIAGFALLWSRIRRLFGGKDEEGVAYEAHEEGEPEPAAAEPGMIVAEPIGEAPIEGHGPPNPTAT